MIKIAILGYGTVGSGTVEVFYKNKESIEQKAGQELDIKYIVDLRDFPNDKYAAKMIKDFGTVLHDEEIKVVVELIGGVNAAYQYVKESLSAGKSVVTSNKELVAKKGAELLRIAREKGVNFFFEASVGGGIPIIRPLHQCLSADKVNEIAGILNGTTNYILTKMIKEGTSFDDALAKAKELGYAEANPAADVEGDDTCRKICILASLAFGKHVYPDNIHTEGITGITLEDVAYCENYGGAIKLIGFAARADERAAVMVCPAFVSENSQLSSVNDVFNAILVRGDATGDVVFYGRGAGKLPTASAVVSDIIVAAKMTDSSKSLFWEDATDDYVVPEEQMENKFYLRITTDNLPKLKADVNSLFGEVKWLYRDEKPENEVAFITTRINEKVFAENLNKLQTYCTVLGNIRVLDY